MSCVDDHARGGFARPGRGYLADMMEIPWQNRNDETNTAELAAWARRLGVSATAHMSKAELIEAIRQQRETNAVLRAEGESVDTPTPAAGGAPSARG